MLDSLIISRRSTSVAGRLVMHHTWPRERAASPRQVDNHRKSLLAPYLTNHELGHLHLTDLFGTVCRCSPQSTHSTRSLVDGKNSKAVLSASGLGTTNSALPVKVTPAPDTPIVFSVSIYPISSPSLCSTSVGSVIPPFVCSYCSTCRLNISSIAFINCGLMTIEHFTVDNRPFFLSARTTSRGG